jgi:hypothetical protein
LGDHSSGPVARKLVDRQKVLDIWAGFADYPKAANGEAKFAGSDEAFQLTKPNRV